jgi:hypothetical protein
MFVYLPTVLVVSIRKFLASLKKSLYLHLQCWEIFLKVFTCSKMFVAAISGLVASLEKCVDLPTVLVASIRKFLASPKSLYLHFKSP